ncbi:N-acetylglucosamine kinase [Rhizobium miluonense]|uniref:N-acetylglucosamine kinase n=1 Tax=Rhizobium miluonense TaxID=411945 RepID=UPI001356534F|nr:BadF/BadG/BcrA/BcrD ATPase family protein [Rhizobium miluonense]
MHLAVDGGNTKTVAIVCNGLGQVLGTGVSGCGDIYGASSPEHAVAAVIEAVSAAFATSGADEHTVQSSVFSLAGVDWPEDEVYWKNVLASHLPSLNSVSIRNDGFAPLRCASPQDGLGVAIVVGTGPAVAARASGNRTSALSFWLQEPFGGASIGRAAMRAVCRSEIGLGPKTALKPVLLESFKASSVEALLHAFTRLEGRRPASELAQLAPAVLEIAREKDPVARAIIREQALGLADYAAVCAKAVGYNVRGDHFPVVLAGSVLMAASSPLTEELITAIANTIPTANPRLSALPSIAGAALDAIVESGSIVNDSVFNMLRATLPDWKANFKRVPD